MAGAGSSWRIGILRPGEDPIGHLAGALNAPDVMGVAEGADEELASTNQVLLDAALRRGSLGLVEAVRQARIPRDHNVLVIVDQFEELFRFRRSRRSAHSRDEAVAFVRLLLEATAQHQLPIYVVTTMRSDFIGDCMDFPGLSDTVNAGLYLVGRMTRDGLRSAITGPVAVAGGTIAPRLVHRVLNDLGDDHDQLPLVQHALMRTWDHWERHRQGDAPIDINDYEAIGTFQNALSLHAEEAYEEAATAGDGSLAERLFKALTDTFSDPRGIRRPTAVVELAAICEVAEADVVRVVDLFRHPGRCFLMPPAAVPLASESIIDVSHESLMRCWTRLIRWAEEERTSAAFYVRLSQAAGWFAEGSAGLWRNPELELAQQWNRVNRPTAAWAQRYGGAFERTMTFLDRSQQERDRFVAERERERRAKLRRTQWAVAVLAIFLVVAVSLAYLATRESRRAAANLELARAAVDESLASADRDPARLAADAPEVEAFRRELLEKAERFYLAFMDQEPRSEQSRRDLASAHFRLGHINRMLGRPDAAAGAYEQAIAHFESLARADPRRADYRGGLANAFNWLGETRRAQAGRTADAERAYDAALRLQEQLVQESPATPQYAADLARTLYNRGILRATGDEAAAAERDFREAIRLLEPLAAADDEAAQGLARTYNNLAGLVVFEDGRAGEAQALYGQAITTHERLMRADPDHREYKLELAKFSNNLAALLLEQGQFDSANDRSGQALELIESLAQLPPSLAIERADAHTLRAVVLQAHDPAGAEREYRAALDRFAEMRVDPDLHRLPDFHLRFGDLLVNLAAFSGRTPGGDEGRPLLARGVRLYGEVVSAILAAGSSAEARNARETLSRVLPVLPEAERDSLTTLYRQLEQTIGANGGPQEPTSPRGRQEGR